MRAPGSGLSPNWAPRARAAHGFGRTCPRLFVQLRDGPRPCVCPGAGLGPSSGPGLPDGPRFLSRHRSSPCACPHLGPAAARRGGLGPGASAAPGLSLSDGAGTGESPKFLPWPGSCPRPETTPGQQPTTSFPGRWLKSRNRVGAAHLCARALAFGLSREGAPAPSRQGAVVAPAEGWGLGAGGGRRVLARRAVCQFWVLLAKVSSSETRGKDAAKSVQPSNTVLQRYQDARPDSKHLRVYFPCTGF